LGEGSQELLKGIYAKKRVIVSPIGWQKDFPKVVFIRTLKNQ
jgi:hypothetical protein